MIVRDCDIADISDQGVESPTAAAGVASLPLVGQITQSKYTWAHARSRVDTHRHKSVAYFGNRMFSLSMYASLICIRKRLASHRVIVTRVKKKQQPKKHMPQNAINVNLILCSQCFASGCESWARKTHNSNIFYALYYSNVFISGLPFVQTGKQRTPIRSDERERERAIWRHSDCLFTFIHTWVFRCFDVQTQIGEAITRPLIAKLSRTLDTSRRNSSRKVWRVTRAEKVEIESKWPCELQLFSIDAHNRDKCTRMFHWLRLTYCWISAALCANRHRTRTIIAHSKQAACTSYTSLIVFYFVFREAIKRRWFHVFCSIRLKFNTHSVIAWELPLSACLVLWSTFRM